jgi:glycosyltransferase involved in cell wall biosynthesis
VKDASQLTPVGPAAPGVNLIGYLDAEFGLGEVARKLAVCLERAGVPSASISYDWPTDLPKTSSVSERSARAVFDTNVFCVNGNQLGEVARDLGLHHLARCYSIGFWFWETTVFPASWRHALHFVDEVWVASEFVRRAVAAETWKPVQVVPLPLDLPPAPELTRADLGLPEGFLFLFSFDFSSVFDRKNPLGLIDVFTRAFAPDEGPKLVVKSINGARKPALLERLRSAAASRADIRIVDGLVSADERNAMMSLCDCYVSLHRSEGLGLTMAEAMAYGKPVIATGYSGNVDFMDEENSYLVPYALARIPDGSAYPSDGQWAVPDTAVAAELMRHVYENAGEARAVGSRARADIQRRFSVERAADVVSARLTEIRSQRGPEPDPLGEELKLALMRVAIEVGKGVGGSFAGPSGRGPGAMMRRLLVRVLWPYLAEQHRVNSGVLDALALLQRSRSAGRDQLSERASTDEAAAEHGPDAAFSA